MADIAHILNRLGCISLSLALSNKKKNKMKEKEALTIIAAEKGSCGC